MTREMKDSGVEWIGEISADWGLSTIGAHYKQRNEKVSDLDFAPLSVTKNGVVPQLDSAAKSSNHNDRKLVKKNDFVINSRSDRKMSCGIANEDGSVSLINIVLYSDSISKEYTKYLLKNYSFAEEFYRWGTGIVADLWSTKWDRMKKIAIPVPTLEEQNKIASTLDELTEKIDSIIIDTKQSIEELKKYKQSLITEAVTKGLDKNVEMKDSGKEFIGEIPIGWNVRKFGNVTKINSSLVNPNDFLNLQQVSPDDIEKDSGRLIKFKTVMESGVSSNNYSFLKGQILYSKIRPKLNKVVIAPFDGLCSADMYPIDTTENSEFILYLMMSHYFVYQVSMVTADRVKMPKINQNELSNLTIVLPNEIEQNQIVSYLKERMERIDIIIDGKEQLISELEQYKKSLIYEYVTGKKEV
ncbi:restriction endonuclease subunit S [Bacillus bingmayongensis]|uniref:restriction endonuclease subunit S n=1 Tax=Bacillus bingmayongensis TaxID=1150157 RepID=UPI0021AE4C10|nr:restriction endonuclease subunit S [Bacillus bingmayongensis]